MDDPRLPSWVCDGSTLSDASPACDVLRSPALNVFSSNQPRGHGRHHPVLEVHRRFGEPWLLELAREGKWEHVVQHCQRYPSEAQPVVCSTSPELPPSRMKSRYRRADVSMNFSLYQEHLPLYHVTALGMLCSSSLSLNQGAVFRAAQALLHACPGQICCRQVASGFTPLAQAVVNPTVFPRFLHLLLTADAKLSIEFSAIHQRDCDGLLPLDHILQRLHREDQKSTGALQLLVAYTQSQVKPVETLLADTTTSTSPLLRFLSLGNSLGLGAANRFRDHCPPVEKILEATRVLVHWCPLLLYQSSALTGCLPLHVALRNYGNFAPLIKLLTSDCDASVWKHRNHYGDLPLHVACAVGVPLDVLQWVLAKTLQASSSVGQCGPDVCIWSTNAAGYTPIDLEWVRHLEAGNGFLSHRVYYPMEPRCLHQPVGREMDIYEDLLERAVQQYLSKRRTHQITSTMSHLNGSFGVLQHRILLIIRSAFRDSLSMTPFDRTGDNFLHLASALYGPSGPRLPRPLLNLIQRQNPEEISQRDHSGRSPLHYCFLSWTNVSPLQQTRDTDHDVKVARGWKRWVKHLLNTEPALARMADNAGRLPLHYALLYPWTPGPGAGRLGSPAREAVEAIVNMLLLAYPASICIPDPVTGLCPFLLAATNENVSLDASLSFLKRFPGAIALGDKKKCHSLSSFRAQRN